MAALVVHVIAFTFILTLIFAEDAMRIEILKKVSDCQRKAEYNDDISMHYVGRLTNGKEFDSSYSRNAPLDFKLGTGRVIPGWEQGIPGMCVGEKRKLRIPPSLAYGDRGFGDIIPAKSTLVFEIELMEIKNAKKETKEDKKDDGKVKPNSEEDVKDNTFSEIDKNGDKSISSEEMTAYITKYSQEEPGSVPEDSLETMVSEIFQEDDKNKDGMISEEEYYSSAAYKDDGSDPEGSEETEEVTEEEGDMEDPEEGISDEDMGKDEL